MKSSFSENTGKFSHQEREFMWRGSHRQFQNKYCNEDPTSLVLAKVDKNDRYTCQNRWRTAAQKITPVNVPEQTKLPGVISDKDIDKTLSTIKTVIQNVWLVNKKQIWIEKTSAVTTDWYRLRLHWLFLGYPTCPLSPLKEGLQKTIVIAGILHWCFGHSTLDYWEGMINHQRELTWMMWLKLSHRHFFSWWRW